MAQYVYILTNRQDGILYIGYTGNLARRMFEHKSGALSGFARRYGLDRLVHYEVFDDAVSAQQREKSLKKWRRDWKIALIEKDNPGWRDLCKDLNK